MLFTSVINQEKKPTYLLEVKSLSRVTANQHIFKDGLSLLYQAHQVQVSYLYMYEL